MSRNIEYKGKPFIYYFVDSLLALIISKFGYAYYQLVSEFEPKLFFPMFEFRNCWVLSTFFINFCNNQSPQIFSRIEVWRAHWVVQKSYFCSSKYFFVNDALWIAALSCWKIYSSLHRWHSFCARDSHLTFSHNLLFFVDHWQIVV